jgi:hypothetical protein
MHPHNVSDTELSVRAVDWFGMMPRGGTPKTRTIEEPIILDPLLGLEMHHFQQLRK